MTYDDHVDGVCSILEAVGDDNEFLVGGSERDAAAVAGCLWLGGPLDGRRQQETVITARREQHDTQFELARALVLRRRGRVVRTAAVDQHSVWEALYHNHTPSLSLKTQQH